jgi:hypothetical protein
MADSGDGLACEERGKAVGLGRYLWGAEDSGREALSSQERGWKVPLNAAWRVQSGTEDP